MRNISAVKYRKVFDIIILCCGRLRAGKDEAKIIHDLFSPSASYAQAHAVTRIVYSYI